MEAEKERELKMEKKGIRHNCGLQRRTPGSWQGTEGSRRKAGLWVWTTDQTTREIKDTAKQSEQASETLRWKEQQTEKRPWLGWEGKREETGQVDRQTDGLEREERSRRTSEL